MSASPPPPLDFDTWLQTGKPAFGIVELPQSSNSSEDGGNGPLEKRNVSKLDRRSQAEKLLFYFVGEGDVRGIREVLRRYTPSDYNANCKNLNGFDLLVCAVIQGDLDVVKVVLHELAGNFPIDTTNGLIKAAQWNKQELLEEIIDFETKRHQIRGEKLGPTVYTHVAEFGTDATPIMVAAIHGHYDIMDVLWRRGERMPMLHYPSCACFICQSYAENGEARDLQRIRKRIALLEAMGSLEWLLLKGEKEAGWDPLSEGIKMKRKIKRCIKEELEWRQEYQRVLDKVINVPGTLLGLCRTSEEVHILLEGCPISKYGRYAALRLALENHHKKFIAEASVQRVIENEFSGGYRLLGWRKSVISAFLTMAYPVVNVVFLFALLTGTIKRLGYMATPEGRFYMSLGSYQTFVAVILFLSVKEAKVVRQGDSLDKVSYVCRWVLILCVMSSSISIIQGLLRSPGYYWSVKWNRVRLGRCLLFYIVFVCWVWEDVLGWRAILRQEEAENASIVPGGYYIIGVYCFCLAVILSILQVFRFTILFPWMGHVQTRFGSLLRERWKLLLIYMLVGSVVILLLGKKFDKDKPSWYAWCFVIIMVVDCILAWYLEFMGISLFGSGSRKEYLRVEYAYQKTLEYWRFCIEEVGLTQPFNLLCFSNCLWPGEDQEIVAKRKILYPQLLRTLSQRYFKEKLSQVK